MVGVREFRGEFRFLSNFWPARVRGPGGRTFATVEHAYQASKSTDRVIWKHIQSLPRPGEAKKFSRTMVVRPGWADIRREVMEKLLRQKFAPGSELAARLVAVDGIIEEGNGWGDTFWGIDLATGEGENNLGRLLTMLREELAARR